MIGKVLEEKEGLTWVREMEVTILSMITVIHMMIILMIVVILRRAMF